MDILQSRKKQVVRSNGQGMSIVCEKRSASGSVSQRACVFCGSRVVLYPIADALHIVHGPIGCAAYTWDIRGSVSSGPELHRLSFSTDLRETDIIFGGEKKLEAMLDELIDQYSPKAAFVYATCVVGVIGDDVAAICKKMTNKKKIPVIPVHSEGFKGTKKDGYQAACDAIACLVGTGSISGISPVSINIMGEFNLAGETWIIKEYFKKMGIEVITTMTGDGRVEELKRAHGAKLNVVQCSGSMMAIAKTMKEKYGIPFIRVSYFGIEDMADALYQIADYFKEQDRGIIERTEKLVRKEILDLNDQLEGYRQDLAGKKAAIYVGGAFKALSLIKALRHLGMKTVVVGSQTGNADDYKRLQALAEPGTIIVDDSNPVELASFVLEKDVDLFIGGVKERPIAYKLGIGFCDHNHERKIPLAGFAGMINFAKEVHKSVISPVWNLVPRRYHRAD
ncbi:MAG: nitrogenase iron-molybdenum cofactor biosynthesis protein NifE [Candidatus Omnitrophica bacterium]|nr:nitrogenase iron-molybdenum cofactor biosynthesis protein NifE [Candidatus Omnitrophota bacterium]